MLGKLVIVGGVGVSSFYVFSGRIDVNYELPQLNYYFVPIIIITISSYFIADVFFGVYEMGVDTLFLCFLEVTIVLCFSCCLQIFHYLYYLSSSMNLCRISRGITGARRNHTLCLKISRRSLATWTTKVDQPQETSTDQTPANRLTH